jgi:hypothetical protein
MGSATFRLVTQCLNQQLYRVPSARRVDNRNACKVFAVKSEEKKELLKPRPTCTWENNISIDLK